MSLNLVPAVQEEIKSTVYKYASQIEAAYLDGRVFFSVPVGVEYVQFGENKLLSFIFEFEHIRGLLPVYEAGEPAFRTMKSQCSGDLLWSYLELKKKDKRNIEYKMASMLSSGCSLPLKVISMTDNVVILSRRRAMDELSRSVELELDQVITVKVMLTTPWGAWCDHSGVSIYIPRREVYYGYVHPADVLFKGLSYEGKVTRLCEGDNRMAYASTRALAPDPWINFSSSNGSIRRAKIIRIIKSGRTCSCTVEFAPGIFGTAEGVPLTSYCMGQIVTVRITKYKHEGYLVGGLIIDS